MGPSLCLELVSYTLPIAQQAHFRNTVVKDQDQWQLISGLIHSNPVTVKALHLYRMELRFAAVLPTYYRRLEELLADTEPLNWDFTEWFLQVVSSRSWIEPISIEAILEEAGLPSKIPALSKIFGHTKTIYSAINSYLNSKEYKPDLSGLSPIWSTLILPRLMACEDSKLYKINDEDVLQQARLYLDCSRPFLLFKFDPKMAAIDHLPFGEANFVQQWAKKLASKLAPLSMLQLCSSDSVPDLCLKLADPSLEIKDASKKVSFQPYEPINSSFSDSVSFSLGMQRSLSIGSDLSLRVEPLWVFRQLPKPGEYSSETAGFLLGLGLRGALTGFKSADAYEILSANHEQVSSGLLLALGLSNIGHGHDTKFLPQLIGIHIPGYFSLEEPQHMNHLPLQLQTAAVISLGFLFKATADRRVSKVLFTELKRRGQLSSKIKASYNPAYCLAAGFALGLVNQNKGIALDDCQLYELISMINGETDEDPDFVIPASFMAVLLLFGGTSDAFIESKLVTPDADDDSVKPVHLMMRILLKSLISGVFPLEVGKVLKSLKASLQSCNTELASHCHSVSAYALYLAIFRAGSWDSKAVSQLNSIVSLLGRYSKTPKGFKEEYQQENIRFLSDILLVSMSIIMAGSGDGAVFSLLRPSFMNLLDYPSSRAYFHHLAVGFLLLGSGRFTLSTDNGRDRTKAAAILVSVLAGLNFPMMEDHHFFAEHMQWLWLLATVPNTRSSNTQTEGGFSAEDVFLSGYPDKSEYLKLSTGHASIYDACTDLELVRSFFTILHERNGKSSVIPDLVYLCSKLIRINM